MIGRGVFDSVILDRPRHYRVSRSRSNVTCPGNGKIAGSRWFANVLTGAARIAKPARRIEQAFESSSFDLGFGTQPDTWLGRQYGKNLYGYIKVALAGEGNADARLEDGP